jgi:[acyl-carrier-protein] S-malonyltransferase
MLGFPLSRLCCEGPAEALRHMPVTQPAVVLTSLVALEVLRGHGIEPDVVAGHSLGEYTALVCAGVLDWTDALRLVRLRRELMAAVNEKVSGKMVAVVGLELADVERMCAQAASETGEVVEVANHNDMTQVVVSGQTAAMDRLTQLLGAAGADRLAVLEISGPATLQPHGRYRGRPGGGAGSRGIPRPVVPVVSGVTARPVTTAVRALASLDAADLDGLLALLLGEEQFKRFSEHATSVQDIQALLEAYGRDTGMSLGEGSASTRS